MSMSPRWVLVTGMSRANVSDGRRLWLMSNTSCWHLSDGYSSAGMYSVLNIEAATLKSARQMNKSCYCANMPRCFCENINIYIEGLSLMLECAVTKKSKEGYSSLQASLPSPLRELTCHMGSHSVTCHPAEVTLPPLPQPKLVLDLATPEGCKAELT